MTNTEFDRLRRSQESADGANPTPQDQSDQASATATSNLAEELQYEKEARREERFMFVVALIVVADAFFFMHMQTWSAPIVIGLIELVLLTVYARRSGINEVVQLLDYALATPRKIREIRRTRRAKREDR